MLMHRKPLVFVQAHMARQSPKWTLCRASASLGGPELDGQDSASLGSIHPGTSLMPKMEVTVTVMDPAMNEARAVPKLSQREIEVVVTWLSSGSKRDAGQALGVSEDTVRTHIARVRDKYLAAGRPAGTKSDLMVRLMQDGHYDLRAL